MRMIITTLDGEFERRERKPWALRAAYFIFLAAGIAALGYAGYALLDSYWYQSVETFKFERVIANSESIREQAESNPAEAVAIVDGDVIGEIDVPRLGMKAIVAQGDSEKILRHAVGHLPQTALPGEAGNIALAGHRDGLFRPLRHIRQGDLITLRIRDHTFRYEVEWTEIVPPTTVQVIQPTSEPALTLVTCFPFYYVGAAPQRFIVRARKIDAPKEPGVP